MGENVIVEKSKMFAIKIIELYKRLQSEKKVFVLSKQILKSGTSIGANVKEASETEYWLELLYETDFIDKDVFEQLYADNCELLKILTSIVKSSEKTIKGE